MQSRVRQTVEHHRGEEPGARAQIEHVERRGGARAGPIADYVERAAIETVEAWNEVAPHGVVALRAEAEELAYRVAGTGHFLEPGVSCDSGGDAVCGCRSDRCPTAESEIPLALDLAADELLDPFASDIVGNLTRRMLHGIGRDRVERSANLAVARKPQASNSIDHHAARIGRILHRHPEFQLDRNSSEALALDPQKADLVVM